MRKIHTELSYDYYEEYEMAPGLIMRIRREGGDGLPEVVQRFLRRKASIGEVRHTLRARGGPRYPDTSALTEVENKEKGDKD